MKRVVSKKQHVQNRTDTYNSGVIKNFLLGNSIHSQQLIE